MLMRTKTYLKKVAPAVFAITAVWAIAGVYVPQEQAQCLTPPDTVVSASVISGTLPECLKTASVSWFDWMSGDSRSYQFHFFDLLELLDGSRSDNRFSSGQ